MTTPSQMPTAKEIIHALIVTMKQHRSMFDEMRERTGLGRTAHRMLMILHREECGCSQARLAEILEISPAAVAVTLKKMETDGYIMRTASRSDNRLNTTELTDKGKRIVEESHKAFSEIDNSVFEGFDSHEMLTLYDYLCRMQTNIAKVEGKEDAK